MKRSPDAGGRGPSEPTRSARADASTGDRDRASIVIPVAREEVAVGSHRVLTGKLRIQKTVRTRVTAVDQRLAREELVVEHVAMDRAVDTPPPTRWEGETLVVPVVAEVLVKQLRLVEEVRITRRRTVERHTADVPLRHEEVHVERIETPRLPGGRRPADRGGARAPAHQRGG
jgi:stress response protein YsnF